MNNGDLFESEIIKVLKKSCQLKGYGLFGWKFRHEIDGLLLLEPGVFVCYEAKCYKGVWTGDTNSEWKSDGQSIASSRWKNPSDQVATYVFEVKDELKKIDAIDRYLDNLRNKGNSGRSNDFPCVCGLVVVPDEAQIKIKDAHVDTIDQYTIYGRSIHICHLSKLVEVLLEIKPYNTSISELIQSLGGLKYIAEQLIHNPEDIQRIKTDSNPLKILAKPNLYPQHNRVTTRNEPVSDSTSAPASIPKLQKPLIKQKDSSQLIDNQPSPSSQKSGEQANDKESKSQDDKSVTPPVVFEEPESTIPKPAPRNNQGWTRIIWIAMFVVFGSLISFVGFRYYQFINKPRLTKDEIKIGILTKSEAYSGLAKHLEESIIPDDFANFLFGQGKKINVSIVGGSDLTYQQAKQSIVNNEWDIAFTLSPSLSVVAKETGYQFIARMFPNEPPFYRSALFVRSDSQIQSIKDLNSHTKVGLGDFKSMSSFYIPLYDLYGKTLTIETGLKRMSTQVKNGVVQVGAGVLANVEKDRELRIIHVSRDIPGSGVYISLSFSDQEKAVIQQVLLNAPKETQIKANYGSGNEPDYSEFIKIRARVEEILSCADFRKNPVKLFCSSDSIEIKGKINGSTLLDAVTLELKVMGENGGIYKVIVPRFIIPNFTQVQNKSLILKPIKTPRQIDVNTYEIAITSSNQISIEDTTIPSQPVVPTPEAKVPTSTNNPSPPPEAPSDLLIGYVSEVRDGDGLLVERPQNDMVEIRLACIDAPEMGQVPWGERSTRYIRQLLPTGTQISYRPAGRDRYERLVAEVFLNNQSINLLMVRQGEAVVYHRYLSSCETDRQKYLDAEAQARQEKLGFWNQSDPEMPWEFRRRYRN